MPWRAVLAQCGAIALVLSFAQRPAIAQPPQTTPLDAELSHATRLLVISPHPDDATLGGAGLIERVLSLGGAIRVVQITSGDAFSNGLIAEAHLARPKPADYRRYGALREREARSANAALGVPRSDLLLLGFPDDGLCELASDRRSVTAVAFESPYTKRANPPRAEQMLAGVEYRSEDLERELRQILVAFRPTIVVMPSANDEHPDHCTTHLLVHDALDAVAAGPAPIAPVVLHYLVHFGQWPASSGSAGAALTPPATLLTANSRWRTLMLTRQERVRKARALGKYKSQMLAIGAFLNAFDRPNELFLETEPEGHAACWCRGEDVASPRSAATHRTATAKQ